MKTLMMCGVIGRGIGRGMTRMLITWVDGRVIGRVSSIIFEQMVKHLKPSTVDISVILTQNYVAMFWRY